MSRKKQIQSLMLLGVISCGMAIGFTEFRSPLSLYRGPTYWPQPAQDDGKWVIESWDAIYHRAADRAYIPNNGCACSSAVCSAACCNKTSATLLNCSAKPCGEKCGCKKGASTRHTEQLSTLFFGKSLFRVEEAFANGILDIAQIQKAQTPALSFSRLAPAIDYSEHGFVAGIHAHRKLGSEGTWRIGARASLPFKVINTSRTCCGCKAAEGIEDVMALQITTRCQDGRSVPIPVFAYRLDFLSSLVIPQTGSCGGTADSLVFYGDGSNIFEPGQLVPTPGVGFTGPTRIAQADIGPYYALQPVAPGPIFYPPTAGDETAIPQPPAPPVFALTNFAGCVPPQEFGVDLPVATKRILLADGTTTAIYNDGAQALGPVSAIQDGEYYQFYSLLDYAGGGLKDDRDAQSKLWIVPAITPANTLEENAAKINQVVQWILNTLNFTNKQSSEAFLNSKCIYLRDQKVTGVGDFDTEVYAGFHGDDSSEWYTDLILGVRYPTGRKLKNPGELLFMPTGNNGHFEVKGAVEGGWNPNKWFAMRLLLLGSHVCSRTEKRAVPFAGAKIRNIGPVMDVDVSYNYFWGNLDFTFFHPEHKNLGCSIGYELWARSNDKLSCCRTPCGSSDCGCLAPATTIRGCNAIDLLGFSKPIDCFLYKCGTATMTHKLRGEIFHRCEGGYFELFGGGYYVIGGRYAMKESEVHIGVAVNF
jgi:hypothetical protein